MGVEAKKELTEQISSTQLALEIKAILDSDKAFSAVLYMWPTFESETLANQIATNYNQIHTLIKSVNQKQLERSFPDVSEGVAQALTEAFPESVKVKIDSKEAFDNLIQDIQNAPKPFVSKVYQIEFPEEMTQENHFDLMINEIETELAKRTFGKHLSALVGIEGVAQWRNLASSKQVVSPKLDTLFIQNLTTLKDTPTPRSLYLTSNVLFGVAISLILVFGMVYATLQLFDVQTPYSFVDKSIDWGRVEK